MLIGFEEQGHASGRLHSYHRPVVQPLTINDRADGLDTRTVPQSSGRWKRCLYERLIGHMTVSTYTFSISFSLMVETWKGKSVCVAAWKDKRILSAATQAYGYPSPRLL